MEDIAMHEYTVYAMRVREDVAKPILKGLRAGEGAFGWSYVKSADLHALKKRYDAGGKLSKDELNCAQWFLLELKANDYVVYINVPDYGQCTVAKISGPYFWRWGGEDFNHHFPVDPKSVR